MSVRIQTGDFDVGDACQALVQAGGKIGAVVTFSGIVRPDDGLVSLTLEHYPGMTEREIGRHEAEARARWPLLGVTIVHRVGKLVPGDNIVLVATASAHRQAAFEAAAFLMDYLKTRAPFWKLEERKGGTAWVEARRSDDAAVERWKRQDESR